MAGINTNIDAIGGGGFGGFNSGWDFILGAMIGGNGLFGNRDKDCCPPATCEQVSGVDRDVLQSANETQDDICCATNTIKDAIGGVGDKVTTGFYALSDKMSNLAYLQQSTAKDIQTGMEKGFTAVIGAIENTSLKERNQYLEDQLASERECKILAAIRCTHEHKGN